MTDLNDEGTEVSATDDLRSSIEDAFDTPETPVQPEAKVEDGRPRDEQGRFAKSDDKPEAPKHQQPDAQAQETDNSGTRKPPASWSKEWIAHWDKLDPAIQDIVLKREADVSKGFEERATKYKPWEQVEQVLAADIAKWQMQGVSAPQLVERLVNAHRLLENPQTRDQAWQFLMQQYGVPQFLAQQPSQQFAYQQQSTTNPVYDQRLAQLEGYLRQQQETQLMSQIETFAKGHSHFEKAAEDIEKLLRQGAATTLDQAYELAIWKNPDIRKEVLAEQAKEQVAKTVQDTSKAKKASSSITGAPTGASGSGPKESLRGELEAAFERF